MEQSKMGISMELLGAVLFITASMNKTALIILVFFVLLHEKNVWIRKTALKAVLIIVTFYMLTYVISSGYKILNFINDISNSFYEIGTSLSNESHTSAQTVQTDPNPSSNYDRSNNHDESSSHDESNSWKDQWSENWPQLWDEEDDEQEDEHQEDQQDEHQNQQENSLEVSSGNQDSSQFSSNSITAYMLKKYPFKIMSNIINILGIVKKVLLIILAFMSLKRKTIRLPFIDNFVDTHVKGPAK